MAPKIQECAHECNSIQCHSYNWSFPENDTILFISMNSQVGHCQYLNIRQCEVTSEVNFHVVSQTNHGQLQTRPAGTWAEVSKAARRCVIPTQEHHGHIVISGGKVSSDIAGIVVQGFTGLSKGAVTTGRFGCRWSHIIGNSCCTHRSCLSVQQHLQKCKYRYQQRHRCLRYHTQ